MLPLNNQIDLLSILKDFSHQDKSQNSNGMSINNLFQTGLTQQQQQIIQLLQCQQQQQQQNSQSQELQERLNLYLQQQQMQLQQQQIQLSDLVALTAQLQSGNSSLLINPLLNQNISNQLNSEIAQQPQAGNPFSNQARIFTNASSSSICHSNTQQNAINNQASQAQFNFSPSAQSMIFQNLQNQLTSLSSRSIVESCSEHNSQISQSNISIQKPNFIQNPNKTISDNTANSTNNKTSSVPSSPSNGAVKPINYNNTIQNPNGSNTGRWTREEHLRFVKGLGMFGKNWKKVEEYVGTRSGAQIRSHAQKFFNKISRENAKNNTKQGSNGKSHNSPGSLVQEDSFPQMRKRQQSTQSNYSCDFVSDDGEGENDLQNQSQLSEIVPQQSKQKDAKEWLHYYRLLQQTCQQNLEAQKQNQNLSEEEIQQMEEQLKKIQIFIQVLSACDNINQPIECASPMSQGSPMASVLPFSFENLNISSPLMTASPGQQQNLKPLDPHQIAEINNFSLDSNQDENKKMSSTPKQSIFGLNSKQMHFGSLFKKYHDTNSDFNDKHSNTSQHSSDSKSLGKNEKEQDNSGGIIQSKLKIDSQNKGNRESENNSKQSKSNENFKKSTASKLSSSSASSAEQNNELEIEDDEQFSEYATNRPNNLSNSAISSNNDQNSTFSTPENQKLGNLANEKNYPQNTSQNNGFNNFQFVGDNIDIESDFNKIKNITDLQQTTKKTQQILILPTINKKPSEMHSVVVPIASPSLENKKTPFFSAQSSPIKDLSGSDSDSQSSGSQQSFRLEPSFFIFFMKKYGKYFQDPKQQSPKLSELVNMNIQQYEQDCVIEDSAIERKSSKSVSQSSALSSPIIKKRQAAERAQNFMDLEEDYGSLEMPIMRKKQSSFSAYSNQNKSIYLNSDLTSMVQSEQKSSSPLLSKYQFGTDKIDDESQQKITNFRKKLKTVDFTNNIPFSISYNQQQQHQ